MACYKTVRGWISGQSLLVLDFVAYPPGGGGGAFLSPLVQLLLLSSIDPLILV